MSANFIIAWMYAVGAIVASFGLVGMGGKLTTYTAINILFWPVMAPVFLLIVALQFARGDFRK